MSEETPQQVTNVPLQTDSLHVVGQVNHSRLYIISGIIITVLVIASCIVVYSIRQTFDLTIQSNDSNQATDNSLNEGEIISSENSAPSVSNLPIGDSVGFYYGREKRIQMPDGKTGSMTDVIAYTHDLVHGVFTKTYVNVPSSISGFSIGKNGADSIVSLSSSYNNSDEWPDTITVLSGTSSDNGVYTKLSKKVPRQYRARHPFLLPGEYHKVIYQAQSTEGGVFYQYDFPHSTGTLLFKAEPDFENLAFELRSVYFDKPTRSLLVALMGSTGSLNGFKIYNFDSNKITKVDVSDPRGDVVKPCVLKFCEYYSFVGMSNDGKMVLYSSGSKEPQLFAVDVSRWFSETSSSTSMSPSFAYSLPYCDMADRIPIFSPDSNLLYCHSFKILDDTKPENLSKLDKLRVAHTETLINVNSATSSVFREYVAETPFLKLNEYYKGKSDKEIKDDSPYLGLKLYGLAAASGDNVIGWLIDNRFLTVEYADPNIWSREAIKNLYINDLKGNKELVDSGQWDYTYLGDLVH